MSESFAEFKLSEYSSIVNGDAILHRARDVEIVRSRDAHLFVEKFDTWPTPAPPHYI